VVFMLAVLMTMTLPGSERSDRHPDPESQPWP
jgi:hypothetical protein